MKREGLPILHFVGGNQEGRVTRLSGTAFFFGGEIQVWVLDLTKPEKQRKIKRANDCEEE